jgi:hypothetical protein
MSGTRRKSAVTIVQVLALVAVAAAAAMCGKSNIDGDAGMPPRSCTEPMDCIPPPSFCADQQTIAFYTNPVCQQGNCSWTTERNSCNGPCRNGGCLSTGTTGGGAGSLGGTPAGATSGSADR